MRIADALAASNGDPHHGNPCTVATILDTLEDADDRAALEAALAGSMAHAAIARALAAAGHRVNQNTIGRHRRGDCRCG